MNAPIAMTSAMKRCSCGGSGAGCTCGGACGSVCQTDSFVRPQFFAGQLLTEDDLQSLEDYVLAKNRLHNRRLFGDGTVCGLTVLCHPCGGGRVVVQPGYALDCCGNDIVLSCAVELDINQMVRDLRLGKLGGYDCRDPCPPAVTTTTQQHGAAQQGDHVVREYCLYVCYCEQETEPVAPYSQDQPCTPTVCQPSRVREGLRFELRCPEKPQPPNDFLASIVCCFGDVIGLERLSQDALTLVGLQQRIREWAEIAADQQKDAIDLRDRLVALIEHSPRMVSCTLLERLKKLKLPEKEQPNDRTRQEWKEELVRILIELMRDCICTAVIPPCQDCNDTCVLLACLKVKACEVVEICNLARRFVPSPAAVRYWLGGDRIEAFLHGMCCTDPVCWDEPKAKRERGEEKPEMREAPPEPPDLAQSARTVQAAIRAVELLQPERSPLLARLRRIDRAFGVLGETGAHERGEAPAAEVSEAHVSAVRDRLRADFEPAGEELAALRAQVEQLQHELAEVKRGTRRTGGKDG